MEDASVWTKLRGEGVVRNSGAGTRRVEQRDGSKTTGDVDEDEGRVDARIQEGKRRWYVPEGLLTARGAWLRRRNLSGG